MDLLQLNRLRNLIILLDEFELDLDGRGHLSLITPSTDGRKGTEEPHSISDHRTPGDRVHHPATAKPVGDPLLYRTRRKRHLTRPLPRPSRRRLQPKRARSTTHPIQWKPHVRTTARRRP